MAADIFLKLYGIAGESQDAAHRDAVQVLCWKWAISQETDMHSGSGGGSGKSTVDDLILEHYTDRASPNLMKYCLIGKPIPSATLIIRRAGGTPLDFYKLTMEQVLITRVATINIDNMPCGREEVRLSFARFTHEYVVQDARGGSAGTVEIGFDMKRNCVI